MEGWQLLESIQRLPRTITIDFTHPTAVQSTELRPESLEAIERYEATFKHVFRDQAGNDYLLERYGSKYCIYWPASGFISSDLRRLPTQPSKAINNIASKNWNTLRFDDILSLWSEDPEVRSLSAPIRLNMQVSENSAHRSRGNQNVQPKDYLLTKYYESLFFIHLPLAYFLKSNLERLKSMYKSTSTQDNGQAYRRCLTDMLLENRQFDKRHEDDNIVKSELPHAIAMRKRKACLEKFGIAAQGETYQEDKNDLCLVLRVREIKLQIILLLESVYSDNLDSTFKDFDARYRGRLKARSLNLTRLIPRRSRRERSSSPEKHETEGEFDCCEQLDLYLDKLCILDILLASEPANTNTDLNPIREHKKNMLSKNKEASSVGFANYVLVPHFTSRTPYALRFIIRKLKGPSLRNRKPSQRKEMSLETNGSSAGQTAQSSVTPSTLSLLPQASSEASSPGSSIAPSHGRAFTTELSDLRSNSSMDEFLETNTVFRRNPSLISRTSSDLTMNHLQRRQLSVTEFTPHRTASASKDSKSSKNGPFGGAFLPQQSFRRVGKRKDMHQISRSVSTTAIDNEVDLVQVMGTPLKRDETAAKKRAKLHNIVESPVNTIKGTADIEATPEQKTHPEEIPSQQGPTNKRVRRKLFAP